MGRGRALALLVLGVLALALTACGRSTPATEADKSRAHAKCKADKEYQAKESEDAEKALDAHCARAACPGKPMIAALCVFRDKTGSPVAEIDSTVAPRDVTTEEAVCDTVRAANAVASFMPIDLYCANDKRCMTCGGSAR